MRYKENSLFEAAAIILNEGAKKLKAGDVIAFSQVPKDALVYEFDHKRGKYEFPFDSYLDPTDGGGGGNAVGETIPQKELEKWKRTNRGINPDMLSNYVLSYFLPKNPELIDLAKRLSKVEDRFSIKGRDAIEALQAEELKIAPLFGLVRTVESYRMLITDAINAGFPPDVIGTTEYDYSFHGGEGLVSSWIMAYGQSESEIKSKLNKALAKVKFEYVGNSMELKYSQKNAIGRND